MFPINSNNFESEFSLESEKNGIVEEKPFLMLVLGDWRGDADKKDFSERLPIEVDRDNFASVMKHLQVALKLNLSNSHDQPFTLQFTEIEDFHPDNLYKQVPIFDELRDLRRRLVNPESFNSAASEIKRMFIFEPEDVLPETASPPKAADSSGLLDQILSVSSNPKHSEADTSSELKILLKDLVRPHLISFDETEQKSLILLLDKVMSGLMREILHHPKFQKIEAAWRSLYFLVRRTETNSQLKIFILDADKDELTIKLKGANDLSKTEAYRKLVDESEMILGANLWSAIFGNYEFSPNVDDIATLMRLSKICSVINAPFISCISPTILGISSFYGNPDHRDWDFSANTSVGKLWSTLRLSHESEYLGLTINKFLLRSTFGSETEEIESFSFEEFDEVPPHEKYVWGNTCFICAALFANSFSKYEWEMKNRIDPTVHNLPVHIYKNGQNTETKPCAEINLTQLAAEKLMEYGLMPLISFPKADIVKLGRIQSIADPIFTLKGMWEKP